MRIPSSIFFTTLVMAGTVGLQAGMITFSSVGTAADPFQYQTYGASVAIEQHPIWAPPLGGSSWVSYAPTGNPDGTVYVVPANGTVVSFFQILSLPVLPYFASVTFRADDSSALYVNGTLVVPEASTVDNQYKICSDFPVGCLLRTEVTANIAPYLVAGSNNVLRFDVAQRHSDSFGLNYAGTASWTETPIVHNPEPATFLMMGLGFAAIGIYRRKR